MAHLGGDRPQDQLSSSSALNNADAVARLEVPSLPPSRRGSREMIAGWRPVSVESADNSEEGSVRLGEVSSFTDFVVCCFFSILLFFVSIFFVMTILLLKHDIMVWPNCPNG